MGGWREEGRWAMRGTEQSWRASELMRHFSGLCAHFSGDLGRRRPLVRGRPRQRAMGPHRRPLCQQVRPPAAFLIFANLIPRFPHRSPIIKKFGGGEWKVVLADHDRRRTGHENEITLTVSDIIAHPEFEEYHNDIGGKKKSGWRGRESTCDY